MTATQTNQRVLINAGQAITSDDLTRISQLLQQQFVDEMLFSDACVAGEKNSANYNQTYTTTGVGGAVYPIGRLSCYPSAGGASRAVGIENGTLAIGTQTYPAGMAAQTDRLFTVCRVTEQTWNLAANASGSDRWDVLSIVMTEASAESESRDFRDADTGLVTTAAAFTRKRVGYTLVITQGTPGAGEPSPSSGVKIAAFLVTNGAGTVSALTGIRDYRQPLRQRHSRVWGKDGWGSADFGASGVGLPYVAYTSVSATGTDTYTIPCPHPDGTERLQAVALNYQGDLLPDSVKLCRMAADGTYTDLETLSLTSFTVDGQTRTRIWLPTTPIWGNGFAAGVIQDGVVTGLNGNQQGTLCLRVTVTDSAALYLQLWAVDWYMGVC